MAEHLLLRNREDLARTDTKASVLAGGAITTTAVALSSGWASLPASIIGRSLLTAGSLVWISGLIALALVIFPRTGTRAGAGRITYFGDVRRASSTAALRRDIERAAQDRLSWLLIQVEDTSAIVFTKYRWIQVGFVMLALGAIFSTLGLVL